MLKITLPPQSRALLSRLQSLPAEVQTRIMRAIDKENEYSIGEIQRLRLSQKGPETLGVDTNRLRLSITRADARPTPSGSILSAIGSNVEYAGAHEFGFRGNVTVRQHTRRIFGRGRGLPQVTVEKVKYMRRDGRIVEKRTTKKKGLAGEVTVRAHTRDMDIKERAPIRRTLEARLGAYSRSVSRAIIAAIEGRNT